MILTKIILSNFQKHEHLVIDLTSGVNVVIGESGVGKSCIVRAIQWVLFNEPKGDIVRKQGTKETSVKCIFNGGTIIEKIKSKTKNLYILTKPKKEPVEYNAIGKEIPQDILDITKVIPLEVDGKNIIINVDKQTAMPFLVDESGSFRMKLFNKLTGYDKIDYALQDMNKDLLECNRNEKKTTEDLQTLNLKINNLQEQAFQLDDNIKDLQKCYNKIEQYEKIKVLLDKWNICFMQRELIKEQIKPLERIDLTKTKKNIDKLNKLYELKTKFWKIEDDIKQNKFKPIPYFELEDIKYKSQLWERLIEYKNKLKDIFNKQGTIQDQQITNENTLVHWKEKYRQILKSSGKCPTCQTELTIEQIEEIICE